LVPPSLTINELPPVNTEALIAPIATLDKFKPVIPDAGMLNKLAPDPENKVADEVPFTIKLPKILVEPVNWAGPMFINVFEPDTIKDPVIIVLPFTFKNGLTIVPELVCMVPADPVGP
jgi:hypothetical protein